MKKENIHWIKSRNWKMKEDNICQKSRQDSGPLCDFSFSCLILISRVLLQSRRICLPSLKKPIRRPDTNRTFCYQTAVTDPDLQMGGGAGGHPDSEVTGGPGLKKIFSAPRASFCSKNNGGRAPGPPLLDPPLDCYHNPLGLSRGRACYVRASAFALRADKKHATCSPARL